MLQLCCKYGAYHWHPRPGIDPGYLFLLTPAGWRGPGFAPRDRFGAPRAEHRIVLLVRPCGLPSYMDAPGLPSFQFMVVSR